MGHTASDFKKSDWNHKWVEIDLDPPFFSSINVGKGKKSIYAPTAFDRTLGKVTDVREGLVYLKPKTLRIKGKGREIGPETANLTILYIPIPSIARITVNEALCAQDPPPPPEPPEEEKPKAEVKKAAAPAAKPASDKPASEQAAPVEDSATEKTHPAAAEPGTATDSP